MLVGIVAFLREPFSPFSKLESCKNIQVGCLYTVKIEKLVKQHASVKRRSLPLKETGSLQR